MGSSRQEYWHGSSVHGILQARILEWVAISFSRRSSRPSDQTSVSYVSCTGSQVLYHYCHLGSPSKWFISIIFSIINSLTQGEKSFLLWVNSSELGETTCTAVSIKFFFLKIFWCGPFLKSIELITILLLFYVLGFWLRAMWDLSFPTKDWPCTPCIGWQDSFFFFNLILFHLFVYLFIFGCAGSLLLCRLFSSCGEWGLL